MGDKKEVSNGLNLLYVGNLIVILASLFMILPVLGLLAAFAVLAGGVVSLVGLARLRNHHEDYMIALIATLAGIVCGLLAKDGTIFGSLMDLAQSVCSLLQTYFVVRGTNSFLTAGGFHAQSAMGDRAWKWQLIVVAVSVVTLLVLFILPPLALILAIVNILAGIVALIFFLSYLKASANTLA